MTALTQIRSREMAFWCAAILQRMTGERTITRHGEHGWVNHTHAPTLTGNRNVYESLWEGNRQCEETPWPGSTGGVRGP